MSHSTLVYQSGIHDTGIQVPINYYAQRKVKNSKIPAAANMVKACVNHLIVYMTQEVPRPTMEKKAVYKSAGGHQMI